LINLSGQRDWTAVLGDRSEDAEEFYCLLDEYSTAEHARQFILGLSNEFDEDLLIVFDGALYSRVSKVTD
jgi:hypothetical protein